jgi:hypothetical protein
MKAHILNLPPDGGKRSASTTSHFTSREGAPSTHLNLMEGWIAPTASLNAFDRKEKSPSSLPGIKHRFLSNLPYSMVTISTAVSQMPRAVH